MRFSNDTSWQSSIARTGFLTASISWLLFLLADVVRPGFVARSFSPHVFLFGALAFGGWWLVVGIPRVSRWRTVCLTVFGGLLLAWSAWFFGEGLAEFRPLVTVLALITPFCLCSLIRLDI